jgi:hypothetical protein
VILITKSIQNRNKNTPMADGVLWTQEMFAPPFLITRDCADPENLCHNFIDEMG